MKKVLKLEQVTVHSFTTLLETEKMNTLKGGDTTPNASDCQCVIDWPTLTLV